MTNELAIKILKEIKEETQDKAKDIEAIDLAIKALGRTAQEVPVQEQLSKYNTKYLVEELLKRDGVEVTIAEPYKDIEVKANGPAIVLKVID